MKLALKLMMFWALLPACKSSEDPSVEEPPVEEPPVEEPPVEAVVFIGCGNSGFWEVGTKASVAGSLEVKDSGAFSWSSSTGTGCSVVTTTAWCSPEVDGTEITWAKPAGARLEVGGVCVQATTHGTAIWDEATCPMSAAWTGCP